MTVTANTTRNDYTAGSAQSVYNYTFQLNDAADVDVYLDGVKQTLNTHYTVQNVDNASGGTITFTLVDANNNPIHPTQGAVISIVMAMDLDRDTNYQPSGAFLASDVNNDFDRLWHSTNQQQTAINRSLRLQDTDVTTSSMELPLKDARKGKLLAFNASTGDPEATSNNQSNWDAAYNDKINSASFSGSTLTLGQQDGGTITASHTPYLPLTGGTLTGNLNLGNARLTVGSSNQLEIYNFLGETLIKESGSGGLSIRGENLSLADTDGGKYISGIADGAVTLHYDDNPKLATTNGGISVTGTITATGYNDSNWNEAYNDKINSASFNTSTGVLTLTQQDSGTVTVDLDNRYLTSFDITTQTDPKYLRADASDTTTGTITAAGLIAGGLTYPTSDGSSNQVLVTNGNGTLSFANQSGGGGGSSLWSANGSDIYYNSGNVGIGETNPLQKLHIDGNALFENNKEIRFKDSGGTQRTAVALNSSNDLNIGTSAGGNLKFINGSSYAERMRIDSSGRVGIGTASPATTLDVNSGTTNKVATFTSTDATAFIQIADSNTTSAAHGYGVNGNNLSLYANDSERMRIDSSGNVGIGTSSPNRKLHVSGSGSTIAVKVEATDGNQSSLDLKNSEGEFRIISNGGTLSVYDQTANNERMRIDSSGNVGIGTSNPSETLTVIGNITAYKPTAGANILSLQRAGATNPWKLAQGHTATDYFEILEGSNSRFTIKNGGNVGIGTNSPSSKLTVVGDIEQTTGDLKYTGAINWDIAHHGAGQNIVFSTTPTGGSATQRMRIDSSGNVIVGGTTAQQTSAVTLTQGGSIINDGFIKPATDASYDIGSSSQRYKDLYLSGEVKAHSALIEHTGTSASSSANLQLKGGGGGAILFTDDTSDPDYSIDTYLNNFNIKQGTDVLLNSGSGNNNVGIGGASDGTHKLKVHGTVTATSFTGDGSNLTNLPASLVADTSPQLGGNLDLNSNNITGTGDIDITGSVDANLIDLNSSATPNIRSFITQGSGGSNAEYSANCPLTIKSGFTGGGVYSPYYTVLFTDGGNTERGSIRTNSYGVSYNTSSDYRLKEDIQAVPNATARTLALKPCNFQWIGTSERVDGFLAHELAEQVPEAVAGEKDAVDSEGNPQYQGVDQAKIVPLLVKTIQELEARITELENN